MRGRPVSITRLRARPLDRRRFLLLTGAAALAGCGADPAAPFAGGGDPAEAALDPISGSEDFYVLWYRGEPGPVAAGTWRLDLQHEAAALGSLDLAFLRGLAAREREHTLQCVESRPGFIAMDNAVWTGLPLVEVLAAAGLDAPPATAWLRFRCADDYEVSLPAADLEDGPLWLVWGMNGEPLPHDHGFPARILAPGRFGWLNPKQVVALTFTDTLVEPPWMDHVLAMYEEQGVVFDEAASMDYPVQCLVVQPTALDVVGGRVAVLGKAYAGSDPVVRVELSTDGGRTWAEAELTYAPGPDVWALWRFVWEPPTTGRFVLVSRATTASGQVCTPLLGTEHVPWPGGMAVEVEVA